MRQHARLAAARAGEDQQRPLAVRDGLALGLVEALQQLLEVRGVRVLGIHPLDAQQETDVPAGATRHGARAPPAAPSAVSRLLGWAL